MELHNENYINIAERSSGKKPSSFGNCEDSTPENIILYETISKYSAWIENLN